MDKVLLKRDDLLEALRVNRDAHQAIFDEAVEGYEKEAVAKLQRYIRDIKKGGRKDISFMMPAPVNQVKDYDRVIKMVEMSIPDEIELTQQEFQMYVMDDWSWKNNFITTNSAYSITAQSLNTR